ncbi:Protein bcn92 [Diplonema papillatum]|nr:Protein bcn92 [Diplonema papillatum]
MAVPNRLRGEVLAAYKALLHLARAMPTRNRRAWMEQKVKAEFRKDRHLRDEEELSFRLSLARTQIDNADVMTRHLTRWLGRDDEKAEDPLEMGPEELNKDVMEYDYDYEKEWDLWRITHPRHCQPNEIGTLQAIDQWKKMIANKKARMELLPKPPKFRYRVA